MGGRVDCRDVKASSKIVSRPTRADRTGADDRNAMAAFLRIHDVWLLKSMEGEVVGNAPPIAGIAPLCGRPWVTA